MLNEILFGALIFSLAFIILICAAALPADTSTTKDKRYHSVSLTPSHRLHLHYSTIRLIMISAISLLVLIDLTAAATRDANSLVDVPMCVVAMYVYRAVVGVELCASVLDFPLFLMSPLVGKWPRVRNIVWIGVFFGESLLFKGLSYLYVSGAPEWLVEESKWKGELAVHWWSGAK